MSDREDKKLNLGDELADVKSLIAGAEDGGFSLDDILAEYGVKSPPGRSAIPLRPSPPEDDGPDLPWPEAPRPRRNRDNVVAFPGGGALPPEEDGPAPQDESEPEKGPSEPEGEAPEADAVLDAEENGDKVVEFPEEESPLASFLKDISKKADDYADRMFEESEQMDPEEVRRLETLIPGTDQETEEDLRYVRRPRRQEPPPPARPPRSWPAPTARALRGSGSAPYWSFFWPPPLWSPACSPRSLSPSPRSWRWDIPSSSGSPPGFWGQVCCCLSTCWPPACGAV